MAGGVVSVAAQTLGYNRTHLSTMIGQTPELRAELDSIREEVIDLAEGKLLSAIRDGSEKSIHFYLRTIGKSRGYSERVVLAGDSSAPIELNHTVTVELGDVSLEVMRQVEALLAGSRSDSEGSVPRPDIPALEYTPGDRGAKSH